MSPSRAAAGCRWHAVNICLCCWWGDSVGKASLHGSDRWKKDKSSQWPWLSMHGYHSLVWELPLQFSHFPHNSGTRVTPRTIPSAGEQRKFLRAMEGTGLKWQPCYLLYTMTGHVNYYCNMHDKRCDYPLNIVKVWRWWHDSVNVLTIILWHIYSTGANLAIFFFVLSHTTHTLSWNLSMPLCFESFPSLLVLTVGIKGSDGRTWRTVYHSGTKL